MTRPVYRQPASGYATLWPPRALGSDFAAALVASGNSLEHVVKAGRTFWAHQVEGKRGEVMPLRSAGTTRWAALAEAGRLIEMGAAKSVTVLRAVAVGPRILFERTDALGSAPTGELLGVAGVVHKAKLDPLKDQDFRAMARKVADSLAAAGKKVRAGALGAFVQRLQNTPWDTLNAVQQRDAVIRASEALTQGAEAEVKAWVDEAKAGAEEVARGTKASLRDRHFGHLGLDLAAPETAAVNQIALQQGWFVRGFDGRRSQAVTERARGVVAEGLAQGLGRAQIGRELETAVPDMWAGMGRQYAQLVAANAMSRARSSVEVSTFQQAGVTYCEIMAMLDERTSDICRALDGQVVPVSDMAARNAAIGAIQNPEDIRTVAPFLRIATTDKGDRNLVVGGRKDPIATIQRSGVGRVDDRGTMQQFVGGSGFGAAGIGAPPYHHNCRTLLLPRTDLTQVPRGYDMRSTSDVRQPPSPSGTAPAEEFKSPARSRPVTTGTFPTVDTHAIPPPPTLNQAARRAAETGGVAWAVAPAQSGEFNYGAVRYGDDPAALMNNGALGRPDNDALLYMTAASNTSVAIARVAASASATQRSTLMGIAEPGKEVHTWVRIDGADEMPGRAPAVEALTAAQGSEAIRAAADALIAAGEQHGWMKRGTLEEVSTPGIKRAK